MRRFFSFKSSASSSGANNSPTKAPSEPKNESVYSEKTVNYSKARMDSVLKYLEDGDSHVAHHRRSSSFSSPATYNEMVEGNSSSLSRSLSMRWNHQHRHSRSTRFDVDTDQQFHANDNIDYPLSSSKCQNCSPSASPYSSPITLRCLSARLQQVTDNNNTLDLYIDGEHHQLDEPRNSSQKYFYDGQSDGYFAENKAATFAGRPPRALSTAPSSPTHSKDDLRTHSFGEVRDFRRHLFTRPRSSHKETKLGKSMLKSQERDSDTTTTVEDIYIDSSETSRERLTDFTVPNESSNDYSIEGPFSDRQSCFSEKGSVGFKNHNLLKQKSDEELLKKMKEVEYMLAIISDEDLELEKLRAHTLNVSALLQMTRNIALDRRNLALELSSQIKSRIAERSSAREVLKQDKFELDTRTRRLQHEKSELQSSLEKELDRRSTDWSLKLEKFQSEEQRLRERVRELAEQNVSFQREISSLKDNDEAIKSRTMDSEMQLHGLTSNLEEARTENSNLHEALKELHERFNGAEEDLDCVRQNYKVKEKENKELQRVVVRLQKMCNEQDKTINGLRQGYSDEIGKKSIDKNESLSRLQMEQVRLTGVEQMLRKELESCRSEVESLRYENMRLLNRLQGNSNGGAFFSVKLDQELRDRLDCLQTQGLSLLSKHNQFCSKLLDLIKCKQYEEREGYLLNEYTLKYQSLRRGIENFRRSLLTVAAVVDEKSSIEALDCRSETAEPSMSRQSKGPSEDELELELKAENLLTKLLRERLVSKELELEQLQSEFASSIRVHDILQTEIQRLQDELSCLRHKSTDMEYQVIRKDENFNQIQQDLQGCTNELAATRGVLMTVSDERDNMWEEVKHSRETIMLLNLEVSSLKKKIEALDEHVLVKEGEISILRDSLVDKPFDVICSPKSVKDFCLE